MLWLKVLLQKLEKLKKEMWFIINKEYINNNLDNLDNLVKDTDLSKFIL